MSKTKFDDSQLRMSDVDKGEIADGKWFPYPNRAGVELKIARMNNDKYLNEYIARKKAGDSEVVAQRKAMAKGILTSWRGFDIVVEDEDGKREKVTVDYTRKRSLTVLQEDDILLDFVVTICNRNSSFINSPEVVLKKK